MSCELTIFRSHVYNFGSNVWILDESRTCQCVCVALWRLPHHKYLFCSRIKKKMRRRNSWIKQPAGGLLVCCELKGFKRNSRRTKTTIESAHTHKQCTGTVLLKPERQTGCSSIGYLCSTYFILYYSIIVSFLVFCMKRFGSKTPPVDIWLSASGCRQMFTRFLYLFIYNFFFRFFWLEFVFYFGTFEQQSTDLVIIILSFFFVCVYFSSQRATE